MAGPGQAVSLFLSTGQIPSVLLILFPFVIRYPTVPAKSGVVTLLTGAAGYKIAGGGEEDWNG